MTDLAALLDRGHAAIVGDSADAEQACIAYSRRLAPRTIRHPDGRPYLTRYYLIGAPLTANPWDQRGAPRRGVRWPKTNHGLYLHHFHASDLEQQHNHPWGEAASLILSGGYVEHRDATTRTVLPGERTTLTRETFHRVELLGSDAWTLFAVGRFVGAWARTQQVTALQM